MLKNFRFQSMHLRWAIVIGAGLFIPLNLATPATSLTTVEIAQYKPATSNLQQFRVNRKLWREKNIKNYRYTLTRSCFCLIEARGPVVITVKNGIPTSIKSVATGKEVSNPEYFEKYKTIPKLFNEIADAIARKADSIDVQYNSKLGYPTQINIDYSSQIADEELYLTIEDFKAL
jgi:hypothetical protein